MHTRNEYGSDTRPDLITHDTHMARPPGFQFKGQGQGGTCEGHCEEGAEA